MARASREPLTPKRLRTRNAERSRSEILEAAIWVFSEFGLGGARVDEISCAPPPFDGAGITCAM